MLSIVLLVLIPVTVFAFSDVGQDHPYGHAISALSDAGVVGGYPDETYRPDRLLNRAEFTKIVMGAISEPHAVLGCTASSFSDVVQGAWYAPYVCRAKVLGLVRGYSDGTFGPETSINAAEAAKIVSIAFGLEIGAGSPWYVPYVHALKSNHAYPPSISRVDAFVNRGEMASMVAVLMGLVSDISNPSVASSPSVPTTNAVAEELLRLTNIERAHAGFPAMMLNADLIRAAEIHANDMHARGYLSHTAPNGSTAESRIRSTGYLDISFATCNCSSWSTLVGENIAQGQKSASQVMQDWMNSPQHRANILSSVFDEIGFARSGDHWVTTFGNITLR